MMGANNFIAKQRHLEQPPPGAMGQGELCSLQCRQLLTRHQ